VETPERARPAARLRGGALAETRAPALAASQRRFYRLVTARDGVRAALAAEGDGTGASLAALLRGDARAGAVRRLEVYANAYFERIHDCLREDFPALAAALGPAAFHDLATAYLAAHPPSHFSLRRAGARLPSFLASAAAEAAWFEERWPWAADLAALEWALVGVFDAAGAELATREALAASPPEAWDALELALQPAVSLLGLAWPAHAIRRAHDAGEAPPHDLERAPVWVLVYRREERVLFRALDPLEASLVARLRAGVRFGELIESVARARRDAGAPALAASLLARWLADGLLRQVAVAPGDERQSG
jgi:hypothetical protein